MKLFFVVFFVTNGLHSAARQLIVELSGDMVLQFKFHPYYNFFEKSCCKFTISDCIFVVNSKGYVHNAYKRRIEAWEYSGQFDVKISKVLATDTGTYRCQIHGTTSYIYNDFQVVAVEKKTEPNPVVVLPKPTTRPASSRHHILQKHQEEPSNRWSLKLILGVVFGAVAIILIISIILAVVHHKKKAKDKCGRGICNSPAVTQQPPQELVYITVKFKPHDESSPLYANIYNSRPKSGSVPPTPETVEYSTLAYDYAPSL